MDAIVIGAGVIGCSLAYELSRRGIAVTVVSASEAGEETTAASFAWANANDKSPDHYARLNHLGLAQHEIWSRTLSESGWFHQTGNIELIERAADRGWFEDKVARHQARGYAAEMLAIDDLRSLEPDMLVGNLTGAVRFPDEGWVDAQRMCADLLALAQSLGARFHPYQRVTRIDDNGIQTRERAGRTRHFSADVCVLAAGNGTRKLLEHSVTDFPLMADGDGERAESDPTLGLTCTTTPVDIGLNHMVTADRVALRPARSEGIMLTDLATGGDEPCSREQMWRLPETLLDSARTLYPGLGASQLRTICVGTRVLPRDGLSIIDWLGSPSRTYVIATHSGVTLAPYIARAVADEIVDGNRPTTLNGFQLSRFA